MKLSMYHFWKTFGRYAFGCIYLAWFSRTYDFNPYVIFFFYNCCFSLMHAWTPFKEPIPDAVLYQASPKNVGILTLTVGVLLSYYYIRFENYSLSILLLSQMLRASVEVFPGKIKIMERNCLDFFILILGLIINQIIPTWWIYTISTSMVSGLNIIRYRKFLERLKNPLDLSVLEG